MTECKACYTAGMTADAQAAAVFYGTTRGGVACRVLRERLVEVWPDLAGCTVLGLGYAAPYLRAWHGQAERCIAAVPAQIGVARWPAGRPNLSCTVEEGALPFPDLFFDRIVLVHGLEAAESVRGLLREVWRVLRDDGRLLVVAPNRVGLWAHVESTPFGHGQPYSPGQIGRLLAASLFRVERRDYALYLPPTKLRPILRSARLWERGGRWLAPHLGGVTVTEAVKDAYAGLPLSRSRPRRLVFSEAA
ncbi:MAG: methyltransferase domain-containing protein [Acetobacteraceae bacterium]